ncbi:MAG: SOS response-associated peptidase [Sandaracinaceae bacterium]
MCGRYTMATPADELIEEFEATLGDGVTLEPHYNIAPTMMAPIVVERSSGVREIGSARFGLVPHWAKDPSIGTRFLNARVETVSERSAFRDPFRRRRCLVVVDGFYEWRREGKAKVPHHFRLADGQPFALAGLWAVWTPPDRADERLLSFTILTAPAVEPVTAIHDRMPVVLPRAAYSDWLDRKLADEGDLRTMLAHHRAAELVRVQVSPRVNSVKNDGPDLVEPVPES